MKITVKPYLLKRRKKQSGQIPIYLRITQNRKYSLVSTGIDIDAKHWNPKKREIRSSHPSADALNRKIENQIATVWGAIEESGQDVNRKQIVGRLKNSDNKEFTSFAHQYADKLMNEGGYHSAKHIRVAASRLTEFAGKHLHFNEITPQLLNDFQKWLANEKKNHPNTIRKKAGCIKTIINEAYKQNITTNKPFSDPRYERVKQVQTNKQALSIEQIDALEALELTEGSDLWHTRNYFMFSFWNAGIRFTDLAFLKWNNIVDGRLIYRMGKTDQYKNIRLLDEAHQILEHYRNGSGQDDFIFPILKGYSMTETGLKKKASSANVIINRNLKKIQRLAGIQTNISFHIARHSFARWADNTGTLDRRAIKDALAHKKMATTETYLDSFNEYRLDEGMKKLSEQRRQKK